MALRLDVEDFLLADVLDGFDDLVSKSGDRPLRECQRLDSTCRLVLEPTVGSYFRQKLEELQDKHDIIGDVRGMGLMQGMELVKNRDTKEPAPQETAQVMEEARKRGLLIGKGGLYGNVIRMSPPLNIAKSDVDEAFKLLDKSFGQVTT